MMLELRARNACEVLQSFFASPSAQDKKMPGSGAAAGASSLD
jgi:hypothetical protein